MPPKKRPLPPPAHSLKEARDRLFKPLRFRRKDAPVTASVILLDDDAPKEIPVAPTKDDKENRSFSENIALIAKRRKIDEPSGSIASQPDESMEVDSSDPGEVMNMSVEIASPEDTLGEQCSSVLVNKKKDSGLETETEKCEQQHGKGQITPSNASLSGSTELVNSSQESIPEVRSALDQFFRTVYTDFKNEKSAEWQRRWTIIPEYAQECVEKINTCPPSAVDEVLRWYARSHGWRPRLKKSSDQDFKMLVSRGIIKKFDEKVDIEFEDVLDIMSKDELTEFAKSQLVGKVGSMDSIKKNLLTSFKEGQKVNKFTGKCRSDILLNSAKRKVKTRYQLSEAHYESLNVLFLLHSPSLVQSRVDDATPIAQGIIQSISRFGLKTPLPDEIKITFPMTIQSFQDSNFLLSALKLKISVQNSMDQKDWIAAEKHCSAAEKRFSQFYSNFKKEHKAHLRLPQHLFRLTTTGVFAKIFFLFVEVLEKQKKYKEAAEAIDKILISNTLFPDKYIHRRGKLWLRRIHNMQHIGVKPEEITVILEKALRDDSVNEVVKAELEVRMEKFLHKGALGGTKLEGWKVVKKDAVRLSSKSGVKEHSKKWVTTIDGTRFVETVEHLGLRMIKKSHNLDSGEHAEGSLFSTLFSLVFYDSIYSNVEDVFISKYQEGPCDFYSPDFFRRRSEQIEQRLEELEDSFELVLSQVIELYEKVPDSRPIIGAGHHPERFSVARLKSFCQCLGGDVLSNILRRILKDPAYRSGMPDLIAWSSTGEDGKYLFCEVKAPNDTLSYGQKLWLKYLVSKDIHCQLLQIAEA